MTNAKDFVQLCLKEVTNDEMNTLIMFGNRLKKNYLKKLVGIPVYFFAILLIVFGIFSIPWNKTNIIEVFFKIYPIFILIGSVFILVLLIFLIYFFINYYKFEEKIKKSTSIKSSYNDYKLIKKDVEFVTDDSTMTIVCFEELNSKPVVKYEVGLHHPNVEYDKLVENHIYHFYSLNNKKLYIIDNIYNEKF